MTDCFVVEGVRYVTVEATARCYTVQVEWVRQVVRLGLIETFVEGQDTLAIAATELERMAKIVQLHFHLGVELASLHALLDR
jgi:hypothetical protein